MVFVMKGLFSKVRFIEGKEIVPEEHWGSMTPCYVIIAHRREANEEGTWGSETRTWALNCVIKLWICCGVKLCKFKFIPPLVKGGETSGSCEMNRESVSVHIVATTLVKVASCAESCEVGLARVCDARAETGSCSENAMLHKSCNQADSHEV